MWPYLLRSISRARIKDEMRVTIEEGWEMLYIRQFLCMHKEPLCPDE